MRLMIGKEETKQIRSKVEEIGSKMICKNCGQNMLDTIEVKTISDKGEQVKVDMCLGCIVDLEKELSKDRRALQDEDPMKQIN